MAGEASETKCFFQVLLDAFLQTQSSLGASFLMAESLCSEKVNMILWLQLEKKYVPFAVLVPRQRARQFALEKTHSPLGSRQLAQ